MRLALYTDDPGLLAAPRAHRRELPVLVFLRWSAEDSTSYEAIDHWHRYAQPLLYEHTFARAVGGFWSAWSPPLCVAVSLRSPTNSLTNR